MMEQFDVVLLDVVLLLVLTEQQVRVFRDRCGSQENCQAVVAFVGAGGSGVEADFQALRRAAVAG